MKKLKFFGKALAALVLAGGMLFSATSCSQTAEDVVNAITGNSTVDNLLGNFKTGTYMGKVKKVKLVKGVNGKLTVTWENPTKEDDSRFKSVNIYLNEDPKPAFQWQEGDECKAILEGLEEGKRYTVSVFALGLENNGQESHSLNPWYGTVRLGESDVTKYQYIGRGYNALTGEYFSESGLKEAILDFDDEYMPSNEKKNTSDVKFSAGTTITEYKMSFNQSVGVEAEFGGFSGSVDVDFSKESTESSETAYASAYGNYWKDREYLKPGQTKLAVLKEHLNMDFVSDLNDETVTPEKLFDTYGTHVMLDTYIGGRFVMNYTFKKTSSTTAQSIEVGVKASYGAVSGSSTTGVGSENSAMNECSSITGYARGGKSVSFSSVETATTAWDDWTGYLDDNPESWSLVDSPNTIKYEKENTGIWLFALDESRRAQIKDYYDAQLAKNTNSLASLSKPTLISGVYIYVDEGDKKSMSQVYNAIAAKLGNQPFVLVGKDASVSHGISYFNLNRGATFKNSTYLYYTTTKDESQAIKGVVGIGSEGGRQKPSYRYSNLNDGLWTMSNGGLGDDYCSSVSKKWGTLYTSKVQNRDGQTGDDVPYLRDIVYYDRTDGVSSKNDARISGLTKYASDGIDIRKDCGGHDIFIQLYY